jgi:hypothetical protein
LSLVETSDRRPSAGRQARSGRRARKSPRPFGVPASTARPAPVKQRRDEVLAPDCFLSFRHQPRLVPPQSDRTPRDRPGVPRCRATRTRCAPPVVCIDPSFPPCTHPQPAPAARARVCSHTGSISFVRRREISDRPRPPYQRGFDEHPRQQNATSPTVARRADGTKPRGAGSVFRNRALVGVQLRKAYLIPFSTNAASSTITSTFLIGVRLLIETATEKSRAAATRALAGCSSLRDDHQQRAQYGSARLVCQQFVDCHL